MTTTVAVRPRLHFLDGVRGFAALVVITFHILSFAPWSSFAGSLFAPGSLLDAPWQAYLTWPARFGNEMLFLFLLISAFSLSWTEDGRRARGVSTSVPTFAKRRAKRIAPVYYASFALGLAVVLLLPVSSARTSPALAESWDLSWTGVLTHLVAVHNLDASWYKQVNSPLWTMAWEIQLYVIFPALYALLRRRPGLLWPTAISVGALVVAVGLAGVTGLPGALLPCWFILGAYLALVWTHFPQAPNRWLAVGAALTALALLDLPVLHLGLLHTVVWGCLATVLLVYALQTAGTRRNPLDARALRWVGDRSFAIYATHLPVLGVLFVAATALGLDRGEVFLTVALVGPPTTLVFGALVYRVLDEPATRWSRG